MYNAHHLVDRVDNTELDSEMSLDKDGHPLGVAGGTIRLIWLSLSHRETKPSNISDHPVNTFARSLSSNLLTVRRVL